MPILDQRLKLLGLALLLAIPAALATQVPYDNPHERSAPRQTLMPGTEAPETKDASLPSWLNRMIERGEVARVTAHGAYYRVTPPCCDRFDTVHDRGGRLLCEPSGGFSGKGGTSCPAEVIQELQAGGSMIVGPITLHESLLRAAPLTKATTTLRSKGRGCAN